MHFLITAGPTREYFDPVRFLSNGSSGKMGYAVAAAAVKRGHAVTLVSGPVSLERPEGVRLVRVVSAGQMAAAVEKAFGKCDAVIMAAAVCDYRPGRIAPEKMTKQGGRLAVTLERTEDILAGLGAVKQQQVLIGFALQDSAGRSRARQKLRSKNLDAIVLNSPAALGAERNDAAILCRGGRWEEFSRIGKGALAGKLVRLAERLARQTGGG